MKRTILSIAFLFIFSSSFAQNEPMLGKWTEEKRTFRDTTDAGRDLINAEYDAYRSGLKKLDSKYIGLHEIQPTENNKIKIVIWSENGAFWASDELSLKNRILLEPNRGNYLLEYYGATYLIKYDEKAKMLLLINRDSKDNFSEFKKEL